jgi:hypothetical protein
MFFMGLSEVALPKGCRQEEMDAFFEIMEPHVRYLMSNFWFQHKLIKSCGVHCWCALIGDGNYKIRRPICVFNLKVAFNANELQSRKKTKSENKRRYRRRIFVSENMVTVKNVLAKMSFTKCPWLLVLG